ncbi:MAG: glutaredoxin domain-containing protein [Betaproteobacteria bacterium]
MIFVYSKDNCPWCVKAKELLTAKGLEYTEFKFGEDFDADGLRSLLGPDRKLTVPQVFFDDELVGGYEDLEKRLAE